MRVMVTGGTGFVGSHTVSALLEAGHEVRLLVRSPEKIARVFGPHGIAIDDFVQGDITDPVAVEKAFQGCDAVFHGAAVVAMAAKEAGTVLRTNAAGVENVVAGAHRAGIESILYVSSIATLFRPGGPPMTVEDEVVPAVNAYARSKSDGERNVRALQAAGAPIRCTYPSGVVGPDDPGLSEANHGMRVWVRDVVLHTSSGFQFVDVRDVARAHVRILEKSDGPSRYLLGGHFLPWRELGDLIDSVTGVPTRRVAIPGSVLRAGGRVGDVVKRFWDFDFPLTHEGMTFATRWSGVDGSTTEAALGFAYRSPRETFSDTIRWLHASGNVGADKAGRLAGPAGEAAADQA